MALGDGQRHLPTLASAPRTARFWRCSRSLSAAAAIYFTQRRRYSASTHGISNDRVDAEVPAVLWTACAAVAIGGLGIAVVVAG